MLCLFCRAQPVCYYPGAVFTVQQHELFAKQYYCPTAVRVPLLEYLDSKGKKVEFVILGNPSCDGPITNDARGTSKNGQRNEHFATVATSCNHVLTSVCF